MQRDALARRASTASSCTSRTRTRWPRFSLASNTRDDGYGGAIANRVRLPLEVYCARPRRSRRTTSLLGVGFSRTNVLRAGPTLTTPSSSEPSSRARAWTSCRCHAAENLTTPNSRKSAKPPIRTPAAADTSACPRTTPMRKAPSAETSKPPRAFARLSGNRDSPTPVVAAGGIHSFEQAEAVSGQRAGRHRRLRAPGTGRPRLVPQGRDRPRGRRYGSAYIRITARRSISVIGR